MGLFDLFGNKNTNKNKHNRKSKKQQNNKHDVIDLAMLSLEVKQVDKELISRTSRATQEEITRIYIKDKAKSCVEGIDSDRLGEILVECYDNHESNNNKVKIVKNEFDLDKETAEEIVKVVLGQSSILTDWIINKERGANYFTIYCPKNDKYTGKKIPIDDIGKYMEFMIYNDGSPNFYK